MKKMAILSCVFAVIYMLCFIIAEQAGVFTGFWGDKNILIASGATLCFFPLFQALVGYFIKDTKSPRAKKLIKLLLTLTLLHFIALIILAAFLIFPLFLTILDLLWMISLKNPIKHKRKTVKAVLEDNAPQEEEEYYHQSPEFIEEINQPNVEGLTPLMRAVLNNERDTVEYLLEQKGIDVNATHYVTGNTALCFAAWNGRHDMVQMFLAHPDTNINIKNYDGDTCVTLAKKNNHFDIADLIYYD